MRCCGSPTTFTGPDAAPSRARNREVAAQFEALLLEEAFKPLATAIGFYGETVVAAAAEAMMRGAGEGVTGALERAIETAARGTAGA